MKKIIFNFIVFSMIFYSSMSYAQTVYGTITNVSENWTYENRRVPHEQCTKVRVPITRNNNRSSAGVDALAGMIIGGIIGKGISGNDKGAAAGAIIGGVVGADNHSKSKPEYREERRCVIKYEYISESVQAGYIVDYMYEGHLYRFTTFKRYKAGDRLKLHIRVSPVN